MKKITRGLVFVLLFVIVFGTLTGCNSEENREFGTMEDFSRAKIGALTGSAFSSMSKEYFPEAEKLYYINNTDLILNMKQGKINGILMDKGYFAPLKWENADFSYIKTDMPATEYAVVFPKDETSEPLRTQVNEFIRKQTENGWLQKQQEKWFGSSEPETSVDFSQLSGRNGTLRVATSVEVKPFDYLKNGQLCGYDAELIFKFAEEYGYALDIDTIDFGAILPGVSTKRYDLAISGITVTDERRESVIFSEPYCSCAVVMAVFKQDNQEKMTLADINNSTLGVVTGTSWDIVAQKNFPGAERKYFTSTADTILALEQGKIDAFFADKTVFAGASWENDRIMCIDEHVTEISNALILAKEGYNEELLNQINEFVAEAKKNGLLAELDKKWFGSSEPEEHPDYTKLTGENGVLKIAVSDSMKPTSYRKGELYTGYEVDFLTLFAENYGYKLDLEGMAFEALIPSVSGGKCDIGAAGITITPERAESVTFADSHFETYGVAIIRNNEASKNTKKTLADYENAVLGVQTGSVHEQYAKERFPNAERRYFSVISDMFIALEQGKIDGLIGESTYVTATKWEGSKLETLDEVIDRTSSGYIFRKNSENTAVLEQLNEFLRNSKENGFLDEMKEKWFGDEEPTEFLDASSLTGENRTLKVAVSSDIKPMCYLKDDTIVGYDMDVLIRFAEEYGYKLEIVSMVFDSILPGVISGKYDIGASGITITPERAQSVDFSESNMTVDVVMVAGKTDIAASGNSFWDNVKASFNKTFIRENRWRLIAEGIGVTILISILAILFGTLLGFGLYLLGRSDIKLIQTILRGFMKVYSRIISGTPVVVILMILFYVVFGNFRDMSGIVVAVIGFTLCFGAFVCDHLAVAVNSVDYGQTEAAYALSYTKGKAFRRIILPQAMRIFMPSYCGQCVDLIKATAVVGYIAVNDLTKMGDIIRSNTYEAFFPLIAVAAIYFIITWLIESLLGVIKMKFEPKRRSAKKVLKGVAK